MVHLQSFTTSNDDCGTSFNNEVRQCYYHLFLFNSQIISEHLSTTVPGIKQVRMTKLKNIQANELLNLLFDNVLLKRNDYLVEELLGPPLLIAAEFGISEFLTIALEKYPRLIEYTNANIRPVLHISVIYRQENIFNILNQGGRQTTVRTVDRDINQNNILHLAGKIAPSHKLNAVSGAALQMQRELQWYKVRRLFLAHVFMCLI